MSEDGGCAFPLDFGRSHFQQENDILLIKILSIYFRKLYPHIYILSTCMLGHIYLIVNSPDPNTSEHSERHPEERPPSRAGLLPPLSEEIYLPGAKEQKQTVTASQVQKGPNSLAHSSCGREAQPSGGET